jgi:hydrogenase nickel incorporation protein HypB
MTVRVKVVEKIMNANEQLAEENRNALIDSGVFSINLMASPGAGKTSLIEKTVKHLSGKTKIAVIDGDVASSIDADRAAAAGALALQINTGGECHLDAVMLKKGLEEIPLHNVELLIVENVGNLICPASFKLGTQKNVLIASIPEGDDKPYKYPGMYSDVDALVINKIDLLPYVPFDMNYFRKGVEILNPGLVTFPISCQNTEGMTHWFEWLTEQMTSFRNTHSK